MRRFVRPATAIALFLLTGLVSCGPAGIAVAIASGGGGGGGDQTSIAAVLREPTPDGGNAEFALGAPPNPAAQGSPNVTMPPVIRPVSGTQVQISNNGLPFDVAVITVDGTNDFYRCVFNNAQTTQTLTVVGQNTLRSVLPDTMRLRFQVGDSGVVSENDRLGRETEIQLDVRDTPGQGGEAASVDTIINLSWFGSQPVDMDLAVIEPNGDYIRFNCSNRNLPNLTGGASRGGGLLIEDVLCQCIGAGQFNGTLTSENASETVFYASRPPAGNYRVIVSLFFDCDSTPLLSQSNPAPLVAAVVTPNQTNGLLTAESSFFAAPQVLQRPTDCSGYPQTDSIDVGFEFSLAADGSVSFVRSLNMSEIPDPFPACRQAQAGS